MQYRPRNSLISLAAQQNDKRLVKYLLRRKADVNLQNYAGNTPLHFCFAYSYVGLGDYLVSKGANAETVNAQGETCYEFQNGS